MQHYQTRTLSWIISLSLLLPGLLLVHRGVEHFYQKKLLALLQQQVTEIKSVFSVDSRTRSVQAIAQNMNLEQLTDNAQLEVLRRVLGAEVLYVLDPKGDTIAEATVHQEAAKKLLGHNYAFRPYFQQARKGVSGTYPAIGVTTKTRGLYHTTPFATSHVLVAKFSVQAMDENFIGRPGNFFLASPEQQIFIASEQNWILRSLNPADASDSLIAQRDERWITLDSKHYFYRQQEMLFNQSERWVLVSLIPARDVWGAKILAMIVVVVLIFTRHLLLFYRHRSHKLQFKMAEQTKFFFELFKEIRGHVLVLDRSTQTVVETYGEAADILDLRPGQSYLPFMERYQLNVAVSSGQREIVVSDSVGLLVFFKEIRPFTEEESSDQLIYCFLIDISDAKKEQREKETMRQQLYHAHGLAAIGEITASIAHEIKNPLTAILGMVELLRGDQPESPEWRILKEAAGRIRMIVDSLGKSARNDYQQSEMILLPVEVENAIILLERIFKKEDIIIERDICLNQEMALLSSLKFKQILTNLLTNARDALLELSTSREKKIQISLRDDEQKYILKVADNGAGIPQANRDKIFQTFFTTKAAGKGMGMGLGILRTILSELQGDISFESEVGVGTTFTIHIPKTALARAA